MGRLEEIKARRAVADLPWHVKTDTLDGPEIRDAYNEVARIDVPHAVWECDDELDGCPDDRRESIRRAEFIAHAPEDIDWLVAEAKRWRDEADEWRTTAQAGAEVLADRDAEIARLRGLLARGR
jgi:hypothetical protein